MKKTIPLPCAILFSGIAIVCSLYASAQNINDEPPVPASAIGLQFQNNSWLPGKFTLQIKPSDASSYGVVSFRLFSFQKYKGEYAIGTSIYLVDENDQQTLMQGGEASGKLMIKVKASDEGKIIGLTP